MCCNKNKVYLQLSNVAVKALQSCAHKQNSARLFHCCQCTVEHASQQRNFNIAVHFASWKTMLKTDVARTRQA